MDLSEIRHIIVRSYVKHFMFFFIVFVFIEITRAYQNSQLINRIDKIDARSERNSQSYIAMSEIGQLLNLPRNFITAKDKKQRVADILSLLIVDRATLSNGFEISKFDNDVEIISQSTNLQKFFFNHVAIQRGKNDELKKVESIAKGQFLSYISDLHDLFKGIKDEKGNITEELPHFISKMKVHVADADYKLLSENSFEIKATYNLTINTYKGKREDGSTIWIPKEGKAIISAIGFFDIQTQNLGLDDGEIKGNNYDGLHFKSFNVSLGV